MLAVMATGIESTFRYTKKAMLETIIWIAIWIISFIFAWIVVDFVRNRV